MRWPKIWRGPAEASAWKLKIFLTFLFTFFVKKKSKSLGLISKSSSPYNNHNFDKDFSRKEDSNHKLLKQKVLERKPVNITFKEHLHNTKVSSVPSSQNSEHVSRYQMLVYSGYLYLTHALCHPPKKVYIYLSILLMYSEFRISESRKCDNK